MKIPFISKKSKPADAQIKAQEDQNVLAALSGLENGIIDGSSSKNENIPVPINMELAAPATANKSEPAISERRAHPGVMREPLSKVAYQATPSQAKSASAQKNTVKVQKKGTETSEEPSVSKKGRIRRGVEGVKNAIKNAFRDPQIEIEPTPIEKNLAKAEAVVDAKAEKYADLRKNDPVIGSLLPLEKQLFHGLRDAVLYDLPPLTQNTDQISYLNLMRKALVFDTALAIVEGSDPKAIIQPMLPAYAKVIGQGDREKGMENTKRVLKAARNDQQVIAAFVDELMKDVKVEFDKKYKFQNDLNEQNKKKYSARASKENLPALDGMLAAVKEMESPELADLDAKQLYLMRESLLLSAANAEADKKKPGIAVPSDHDDRINWIKRYTDQLGNADEISVLAVKDRAAIKQIVANAYNKAAGAEVQESEQATSKPKNEGIDLGFDINPVEGGLRPEKKKGGWLR